MKQISVPFKNFDAINRLHRRLGVKSDYNGQLIRDGQVVGHKTASNPIGRIIFNLYRG